MRIADSGFCILSLIVPFVLRAEIIDRIIIAVGNEVITQSQLDSEIRVTAFLNREPLDLSAEAKKQAAKQLIDQALIKREMDISHYPVPDIKDTAAELETLKAMYPAESEFQKALSADEVTEDDLTQRLWWQLTVLRFIDYRFRPGIQVPPADVQAYYRHQLSDWQQKGTQPIPTLEESRGQIEEILTQQRIDEALEQWMKDARNQVAITYRDTALQ